MSADMVGRELCVMCFQDPKAAKKARSLSVNQTALDDTYNSCNSKHSGDWKQQQLL